MHSPGFELDYKLYRPQPGGEPTREATKPAFKIALKKKSALKKEREINMHFASLALHSLQG